MATDLTALLGGGGGDSGPKWESLMKLTASNPYLMLSGSSGYGADSYDFWNHLDNQGAYLYDSSITSYTTIVNITGVGRFGGVIGSASLGSTDYIKVTIDGEAKEFRFNLGVTHRAVLVPTNVYLTSGTTYTDVLRGGPANAYNTQLSTVVVTEASLNPFALPFKQSLKVEIKSATARWNAGEPYLRQGVFYVLDN